ncbi:MAG: class I SAM-dependent methyltransferase, partial [Candidatus Neomarinimicrobiota bacterium]
MVDIYTNPDLYDSIHHDYEWDKTLIKAIAKDINGPVLELASGTGRLTQPILELGLQYKGLELSQPFLDRAKMKFGDTADFILGDMRDFDLQMEFDLIFIGFNSFLHNLKIEDA